MNPQNQQATSVLFSTDGCLSPAMRIVRQDLGINGTLSINTGRFQFVPLESEQSNPISIDLKDLSDVDFTNILSKSKFIITKKDGSKYAFAAYHVNIFKKQWWRVFIPFGGVSHYRKIYETAQNNKKWADTFSRLTPGIYRGRDEIKFKNVTLGIIIAVLVMVVFIIGLIALVPAP